MNRKSAKAMNGSGRGSGRVPVTLRLPEEIVKKIDEDLDHRDVPVSRNNWLLEAAVEKLRKKNQGGRSYGAK
jgi:hypothetical protein